MMLYLDRMCQCGLQAVPWSHICNTYALPRCRTSQYLMTFVLLSVSLWNNLADTVLDAVGLAGFKSMGQCVFIGLSCSIPIIVFYYFSHYLLLVYRLEVGIVGLGSSD